MRRNQVAVVGAAETTELGVIPNVSQIQLHADAALNAIADAGLKLSDIDGIATAVETPQQIAHYLGITVTAGHLGTIDVRTIGALSRPGALVCAVGANNGTSRELDNQVLERASFVCCDSIEDARLESADLFEPIESGVLDWLEVHELQEVVAGEVSGRSSDEDIVVFKSNGLAAWDVAAGALAVERAREKGLGTAL